MKINGKFIVREIAGEAILVPVGETALKFNGVISLNPVGKTIWKSLENGRNREEILADILEEFDVPEETARADMDEYLSLLAESGLILLTE